MEKVGFSADALISRHRRFRAHPIFNPDYARENLVSLAETVVMLYFYFVMFVLALHYLVLLGFVEPQTIPWMLIESSTAKLLVHLPSQFVGDRSNIFLALVITIVAARLTRHAFEIVKADLHPKEKAKGKC